MSTFDRMKTGGYPTVLLREQHRMTAGLAQAASDIVYDRQFIGAPSTALHNRIRSQSFLVWTTTNYAEVRGSLPALLLDVRRSRSARLGRSVFNLDIAAAGINVILSLLHHGFQLTDITVRVKDGPSEGLQIKTVDGFQGGEAPLVILDYAITNVPGFTRDRHRFNVAITRAQDGLVVITDYKPTRKAMRDNGCTDYGFLTRYLKTAGRAHAIDRGDAESTSPFVTGLYYQVDPTPDAEEEDGYDSEAEGDQVPANKPSHINIEICASVQAIKYIHKYVYKGSDQTTVTTTTRPDTATITIQFADEIIVKVMVERLVVPDHP
ncbi:MAG: Tripartite DNA replication factor [Phylliscum demangeonii]|nr:MAG: Tripartite DNA replication factor [Phylliscum demangeonii]